MLDNYTLEGEIYSQEEVSSAAEAKGLTVEAYISKYYSDEITEDQPDSYMLGGEYYSIEEISEAARAKGLSGDNYVSKYYPDEYAGKSTDPAVAEPIVGSENTASTGVESSTESVPGFESFGKLAMKQSDKDKLPSFLEKTKKTWVWSGCGIYWRATTCPKSWNQCTKNSFLRSWKNNRRTVLRSI